MTTIPLATTSAAFKLKSLQTHGVDIEVNLAQARAYLENAPHLLGQNTELQL